MALLREVNGIQPQVHEDSFLAETAVLVGDIHIAEGASVWYNAVLRADIGQPVIIGKNSNVQDNCVLHTDSIHPTIIGEGVTLGHSAIVHAARIGDRCLIGMGSMVLDGAEVGEGCVIGANAVVSPGKVIPPYSLVLGTPGKVVRTITPEELERHLRPSQNYVELWRNSYRP